MNKKVLTLLAASAAVLGSAIFAAPASAVKQEVDVDITVDEVLFLKTFDKVELRITQNELSGDFTVESGTEGTTDGSTQLNLSGVSLGDEATSTEVTKDVNELYAVYSNSRDNVPQVRVKADPTANRLYLDGDTTEDFALMTVEEDDFTENARDADSEDVEESVTDGAVPVLIGGVQLKFQFKEDADTNVDEVQAGNYTGGRLIVEAISIGDFPADDSSF